MRFKECADRVDRNPLRRFVCGVTAGSDVRRFEIDHAGERAARINGGGAGEAARRRRIDVRSRDVRPHADNGALAFLRERIVNADKAQVAG